MTGCMWCGTPFDSIYSFSDLLFRPLKKERLCQTCYAKLDYLKEVPRCSGCGRHHEDTICQDCAKWQAVYPNDVFSNLALYKYNDFAKELMEGFKFNGDAELGQVFSKDVSSVLKKRDKKAMIIPIPISQRSQEKRGFNQVEIVLKQAGITYTNCLTNITNPENQSKKDRRNRLLTPQPFQVMEDKISQIKNRTIIIVDDVYTTGRTIFHAADAIRIGEPASIQSVTLFR